MRLLLRLALIADLLCLLPSAAWAGHGGNCKLDGLEHLRAAAPDGFAIYRQISDRAFFLNWMDCDDAQYDLPTAVHESTHFITGETDAFPLVGGGAVKRPHEVSGFFPPSRIAGKFKSGGFVTTYLRPGTSSSATDFLYLLDELNAYSHGLAAAVDLRRLSRPDEVIDHRDGLAAMMAFVAVYAETAQDTEPTTWNGLQQPQVAETLATLWKQGERVLASSCGIPNFGAVDKPYIRQFCTERARSALEPILGRPPTCPAACLTTEPDTVAGDDTAPDRPDAVGVPHPAVASQDLEPSSWLSHFIQRLSGSNDGEE